MKPAPMRSSLRLRDQAGEDHTAVDVAIDQVAVGRADRHAGVNRDAAELVAVLRPVKLLVDHRVDAVVAAMLERHAGAERIGEQSAVIGEPLIVELSGMAPGADHDAGREAFVLLAVVVLKLGLADEERRVVDAEVRAKPIADLLIAAARSGRIAVQHGDADPDILDGLDLEANARRRQRIGRTAAWQVHRSDGRPIALQEHLAEVAEEEFAVGGDLADLEAGHCRRQRSARARSPTAASSTAPRWRRWC